MSQMQTGQPEYTPPAPKKGMGPGAVIGIILGGLVLLVVLCGGLSAALLMPALKQARETAQHLKSGAQMRAIAQQLIMYAQDNAGDFPPAGTDLSVLFAQELDPSIFVAPNPPPSGASYIYVPVGNERNVKDPTSMVLLYENPACPTTAWNVAYLDGRVELISGPEAYRTVIDAIRLPTGVPFTPPR